MMRGQLPSKYFFLEPPLHACTTTVPVGLHASLPALGIFTAAWVRYCTMNFTGSTSPCDRVFFKLPVTVHRCLNDRAPPYLSDYCIPASSADTRQHLHCVTVNYLQYLAIGLTLMDVVPFQLPASYSLGLLSRFHPGPELQCRLFQSFV